MTLDAVLARIDEDLPQALDRLLDLLRIPSISTDPAYKADCDRAADWLVADLASLGFTASKRPTPGHPMVVAHSDRHRPAPPLLRPLRRATGRSAAALAPPALRPRDRGHAQRPGHPRPRRRPTTRASS